MMKNILILFLVSLIIPNSLSQDSKGVAINTTGAKADESAILDVSSMDRGVLFPRLTSVERDNISNPSPGLIIFNTTRKCLEFYSGMEWTSSTPAGTIMPFAGKTNQIPDGWLLCDGEQILESDFPDLFKAISNNWKDTVVLDQGKFRLPDLRGYFLRGALLNGDSTIAPDANNRLGGSEIEKVGSAQGGATMFPNFDFSLNSTGSHFHYVVNDQEGNDSLKNTNSIGYVENDYSVNSDENYKLSGRNKTASVGKTNNSGDHTHNITGGDKETRPVNKYVNYIIKY